MSQKEPSKRQRKRRSATTLADVAEALGVSKATISLAINGSKEVSEKTREKVIRKIDEMGYVYNRGAAGLSTGENRTVGLAVHDINNPYFTKVCASIEEVLSLNGRMSFLCNTDESLERQQRFIGALVEHNADGLILCPTTGTCVDDLRPLIKRRFPIVLMAHDLEGSELDFVGNDDMLASKLATEHLIGLGHRRIAMIGGSRLSAGRLRRAGCLAAMEDAGLEVDQDLLVSCPNSPDGGSKAVKAVMSRSQPPTGIVCWTDLVALGAFSGLVELGLKPGKDIALIGCDGIAEGERAYVRLSTVNVQKTAIGRTAAEMLVRRLGDPDIPPQRVITKPSLVIRDTCCPGPASGN